MKCAEKMKIQLKVFGTIEVLFIHVDAWIMPGWYSQRLYTNRESIKFIYSILILRII